MKRWALPLAIAILALLSLLWFLASFERRSDSEETRPSAEARRDLMLAARRLVVELGLSERQIDALHEQVELTPRAALLLPAPRGAMGAALIARIDSFVREGGHLIIESELLPLRDPLLEGFGIARVALDEDDSNFAWSRAGWNWREPTRSGNLEDVSVVVRDGGLPDLALRLRGPHALVSEHETHWTSGEGEGRAAAVQLEWGQGRVTALNSFTLLHSWEIGRYDHAEFLHWLLRNSQVEAVLFVRPWHGGLLKWVGTHAGDVIALASVLLILLLWAILPRFGPLQPDPEPARRRLLDHLTASGRLLWSREERAVLGRAACSHALHRVRAEFPHSAALSGDALATFLVRRFDLDPHQAGQMARNAAPTQPLPFLALLRACRRIHLVQAAGRHVSHPLYES